MSISSTCSLYDGAYYTATKAAYEKLSAMPDKRTDEAMALESTLQAWGQRKAQNLRMLEAVGPRYARCTFDNYEITNDAQRRVIDSLRDYARNARANIDAGRNVILIGPKGAGKDHLLTALSQSVFMETGTVTRWKNGPDLLEDFHRWSVDWESKPRTDPNTEAEILYVSDPLPPTGALSEAKMAAWFKLADARYRAMKPTWISMNVVDGAEAEARMGSQTVDRLRDNALVLVCAWESHRKATPNQ